jgi:hypothetical protein
MDSKGAGLVRSGGHDAPLLGVAVAAHNDRSFAQFWAAELLHRRVEGVHVNVKDGPTVHGVPLSLFAAFGLRVLPERGVTS